IDSPAGMQNARRRVRHEGGDWEEEDQMKHILLLGVGAIALAAGSARAQTATETPNVSPTDTASSTKDDATGAGIVVTGSRAVVDGARAPTPVTVLSIEQLTQAQPGL